MADALPPHADRMIQLLWADRPLGRRGPKPGLTAQAIARAGIGIADAEGLGAVSMQRVAAAFGVTTMALYRHVPGKAELVDLMFDTAMGPAPALDRVAGGWRGRLKSWTERIYALFHAHPWGLDVLNRLRVVGPNELGWMEAALSACDGAALTPAEALDAMFALIGHARVAAQYAVRQPDGALDSRQWGAALDAVVRSHADTHPALMKAMQAGVFAAPRDDGLAFGVERILDGVKALIAARATSAAGRIP